MSEANRARYLLDPLYHHAVDLIVFASLRAVELADERYEAAEENGARYYRTRYDWRRRQLLETLLSAGGEYPDVETVALAMTPAAQPNGTLPPEGH